MRGQILWAMSGADSGGQCFVVADSGQDVGVECGLLADSVALLADSAARLVEFMQFWSNLARLGSRLVTHGPKLVEIEFGPAFVESGANFENGRPNCSLFVDSGRRLLNVNRVRPVWTRVCPHSAQIRPNLGDFGRSWPRLRKHLAVLREVAWRTVPMVVTPAQLVPSCSGGVRPDLAEIVLAWACFHD